MDTRKTPIHTLPALPASTCRTCCIFKDSPREKKSMNEIIKWELGTKHLQLKRILPFFQTSPTCSECVGYASSGISLAAVMCNKLVDESAFACVGVDACQVRVWVHGPGQKLLLWSKQCHMAEVPVLICKTHMDF